MTGPKETPKAGSEETHGAEHSSAQGIWRSVLYSAIFGWIVLLAITFAIQKSHETEIYISGFPALTIFSTSLSTAADKVRAAVRVPS